MLSSDAAGFIDQLASLPDEVKSSVAAGLESSQHSLQEEAIRAVVQEMVHDLIATGQLGLFLPGGSRIEVGESPSSDGPILYLALAPAPRSGVDVDNAGEPVQTRASIMFWIDPTSHQPMLDLRMGSGNYRTFPLDKVLLSLPRLEVGQAKGF